MKNGGYLTRDQILTADDLTTLDVSVPEWGGTVRVRAMTATALEEYQRLQLAQEENGELRHIRESLVAFCIVDETGARVFSPDDVAALGAKSGAALSRVWEVCAKLNAVTRDETEQIKKNSETGRSAGSPSD